MTIHTVTLNPVTDLIYLIDRFEKGTTFRCPEFLQVPAGKGINVSYILSCYGIPSVSHAIIGDDEAHSYQKALEDWSVTPALTIAPIRTRKHCTLLEKSTGSVTHTQIHSQPIPKDDLDRFETELFSSLQEGDIAVFSGSLPKSIDPGLYAKWIQQCHDINVKPVFDSSGDPLRLGVRSSPWVIKSNEHEAEELIGKPVENENDIEQAARWIQSEYNIKYVILSLGSKGIAAATKDHYYRLQVRIDSSKIIDSVGCGDAVAGGFLYAWMQNKPEQHLFAYAITTATAAATVIGPGKIETAYIEKLLPLTDCKSI